MTVSLAFAPEVVMAIAGRAGRPAPAGPSDRGVAGLRAWPSRCSRALWTAHCSWPRPWTPGATGGGWRWPRAPGDWAGPRRPAAAPRGRRRCTAYWTPARCPAAACPSWRPGPCWWRGPGRRRPAHQPHPVPPDAWRRPEWMVVGLGGRGLAGAHRGRASVCRGSSSRVTPLNPADAPRPGGRASASWSDRVPAVAGPRPPVAPRRPATAPSNRRRCPVVTVEPVEGSRGMIRFDQVAFTYADADPTHAATGST